MGDQTFFRDPDLFDANHGGAVIDGKGIDHGDGLYHPIVHEVPRITLDDDEGLPRPSDGVGRRPGIAWPALPRCACSGVSEVWRVWPFCPIVDIIISVAELSVALRTATKRLHMKRQPKGDNAE